MALGYFVGQRPFYGLKRQPNPAEFLIRQAVPLNDYSPTFTRASTAYDPFNRTTVASGARRRRPLPIDGGFPIWADLIESSRTNLCVRSSDFANWGTKTDITVTSAAYTPQDGTGSADLITEGTAGTAKALSAAMTITAARIVVAGVRFKASANNAWVMVTVASDTLANGWRVWANISTGVVGTQSLIGTGSTAGTAYLTSLGSGEYLLVSAGKVAAAATSIQIQVNSASGDTSTTRVNGAAYYAWAAQVEMMAASATSGNMSTYIATTTASVTRSADVLGSTYVLGQAGTVLALCIPNRWTGDQDGITSYTVWRADDTGPSRVARGNATGIIAIRNDAGGAESGSATHGFTDSALAQLAMTWDSTAVRPYVAGVQGVADTTLTAPYSTNTNLYVGGFSTGAQAFFGWVALLAWPRALSASELLTLNSALPVVA